MEYVYHVSLPSLHCLLFWFCLFFFSQTLLMSDNKHCLCAIEILDFDEAP